MELVGGLDEVVSVPNFKVLDQLGLCVVDALLVVTGLVLEFLQFSEGGTVLPFELLHLFELEQLLLVNNVFRRLVVVVQERALAQPRLHHVLLLLLLSDRVQCVFQLVDLGFDRVALLSGLADQPARFLHSCAALPDGILVLRTRLRFEALEFQKGCLLVDCGTGVCLARAAAAHSLEHSLLLLLVELLVVCALELFKFLHPCDFLLPLF